MSSCVVNSEPVRRRERSEIERFTKLRGVMGREEWEDQSRMLSHWCYSAHHHCQ